MVCHPFPFSLSHHQSKAPEVVVPIIVVPVVAVQSVLVEVAEVQPIAALVERPLKVPKTIRVTAR